MANKMWLSWVEMQSFGANMLFTCFDEFILSACGHSFLYSFHKYLLSTNSKGNPTYWYDMHETVKTFMCISSILMYMNGFVNNK